MQLPKVFLATPAYSGTVHAQYAISLADTQTMLSSMGIGFQVRINVSNSLLVAARNNLVEDFIETDCTHMLFVDSDLGWPAQSVKAMLDHDEDFVAGIYPSRKDRQFMFRPMHQENGSMVIHGSKKLIRMEGVPAGFMLLKRGAIETMRKRFNYLRYAPKSGGGNRGHMLFNTELIDGEFWGEDYVFCNRAREAGLNIWVDPFIQFDHDGVIGMFAETLETREG